MTLDEAIQLADKHVTTEWKGMSLDLKRAFGIVIDAAIDQRDGNGQDPD